MQEKPSTTDVFNRDFLEIRSRIIDIAAALDRCHFGENANSPESDPRVGSIKSAIETLIDGRPDRAERVQMIFSDDYDVNWRGNK